MTAPIPVLAAIIVAAWLQSSASPAAADSATGAGVGTLAGAGAEVGAGGGTGTGTTAPGRVLGGDITVVTVMAPGSLVISVPLRQPALTGRLEPIVVTDNRTGDPGWTVTAILTGRRTAGLGWNPNLIGAAPGESIALGPKTGPWPVPGQPQILASANPGASLGTARLDAVLGPDFPTAMTFTLTAI